jgi:hypothetical protein
MSEQQTEFDFSIVTDYEKVVENGEVKKYQSRHSRSNKKPKNSKYSQYRDVIVEYLGRRYVFYYSTAIVVDYADGRLRLANGGWETKSTKERINRHLPKGYKLTSEDSEWGIDTPDGRIEFKSGMVIDP